MLDNIYPEMPMPGNVSITNPDMEVIIDDELPLPEETLVNDSIFNINILNLFQIPEDGLDKLAVYLFDVTEEDKKSRQPWLDIINKVKPYLGYDIELPERYLT